MANLNFAEMIDKLEDDEIELGTAGAGLYMQLFALYLHEDRILEANMLWRRVPDEMKSENNELKQLQLLSTALSQANYVGFYDAINYSWSDAIKDIMHSLAVKTRQNVFGLYAVAFTSIFEDNLLKSTGLTKEELRQTCQSLDWKYETNSDNRILIMPKAPPISRARFVPSEDEIAILTDFISFLEN